jgi:hypothetical protein
MKKREYCSFLITRDLSDGTHVGLACAAEHIGAPRSSVSLMFQLILKSVEICSWYF